MSSQAQHSVMTPTMENYSTESTQVVQPCQLLSAAGKRVPPKKKDKEVKHLKRCFIDESADEKFWPILNQFGYQKVLSILTKCVLFFKRLQTKQSLTEVSFQATDIRKKIDYLLKSQGSLATPKLMEGHALAGRMYRKENYFICIIVQLPGLTSLSKITVNSSFLGTHSLRKV